MLSKKEKKKVQERLEDEKALHPLQKECTLEIHMLEAPSKIYLKKDQDDVKPHVKQSTDEAIQEGS